MSSTKLVRRPHRFPNRTHPLFRPPLPRIHYIMNTNPFLLLVTDLLGRSGAHRDETIVGPIEIKMDLERVEASHPVTVQVRLEALREEILARGTVTYQAALECNRCLTGWTERGEVTFTQLYGREPDEDTQPVTRDGHIDLEPTLRDEVSLALPLVPLCRDDCQGLCPTCGTDLNTAPCSGHAEENDSPFSALRQLLEP